MFGGYGVYSMFFGNCGMFGGFFCLGMGVECSGFLKGSVEGMMLLLFVYF